MCKGLELASLCRGDLPIATLATRWRARLSSAGLDIESRRCPVGLLLLLSCAHKCADSAVNCGKCSHLCLLEACGYDYILWVAGAQRIV